MVNIFLINYNFNPLSANPTKWSNTLKRFVGKLSTSCLSAFDHLVGLALKGLTTVLSYYSNESLSLFCGKSFILRRKSKAIHYHEMLSCLTWNRIIRGMCPG